jgi:hypothetical protein
LDALAELDMQGLDDLVGMTFVLIDTMQHTSGSVDTWIVISKAGQLIATSPIALAVIMSPLTVLVLLSYILCCSQRKQTAQVQAAPPPPAPPNLARHKSQASMETAPPTLARRKSQSFMEPGIEQLQAAQAQQSPARMGRRMSSLVSTVQMSTNLAERFQKGSKKGKQQEQGQQSPPQQLSPKSSPHPGEISRRPSNARLGANMAEHLQQARCAPRSGALMSVGE